MNHLKYLGDKITRKLRDLSQIRISRYLFLKYTINLILSDLISIFVFEKLSSKIDRCLLLEEKNMASLITDCENHCRDPRLGKIAPFRAIGLPNS